MATEGYLNFKVFKIRPWFELNSHRAANEMRTVRGVPRNDTNRGVKSHTGGIQFLNLWLNPKVSIVFPQNVALPFGQ